MSKKITNSLSSLMKKQNMNNANKKNYALKYKAAEDAAKVKNGEKIEEKANNKEEELSEEEQLEEAKKASKNKAKDIDQTEMIKKLIMENIIKYTVLIGSLIVLTYGIINFAPAVAGALKGMLHELFVSALTGG